MTIQSVRDFYRFTFSNEMARAEMMNAVDLEEFVNIAVKVGAGNGFEFSKEEMRQTIHAAENKMLYDGIEFPNLWIKEIMIFGWMPLGCSK